LQRRTLNLGIVAHVDAGKTTLTERLLYAAGVIDELGSVDDGSTQTDSLALEQQRGITIRSAVVSFAIDDVTVNLIDTPGHPDFIAEVERVLSVLDGAVLVISAVEGVQPQTPLLMRALQRLHVPTLIFVNKIDRRGADTERVLRAISERLTPAIVPMGSARELGTLAAEFTPWAADDAQFKAALAAALAEHDDALLAAYVNDEASLTFDGLRDELAAQTRRALIHPVFFGSAVTGAGVDALQSGIAQLLPAAERDVDGPVSGSVFKIERGSAGEKIAYARMFSGTLRTRDRLQFGENVESKVTAVSVFDQGSSVRRPSVSAGEIAMLWGLTDVRIGDAIGALRSKPEDQFAPPTLEAVVAPRRPDDKGALYLALEQLAEQDPLIDVRRDDSRHELSVSLYGEVQKEVIQATLANDFGLDVEFQETTPLYIERPIGTGEAVELLNTDSNPFNATIGLRIEPGPRDSGIDFGLAVDNRTIPLYVYGKRESFAVHMGEYVREALKEGGPFGWQVTDCLVTMTQSNYSSADGPPSTRGPMSTAADFRKLTPLVVMQALERAGTVVCEPNLGVSLEVPTHTIGAVMPALARLGASLETPSVHGKLATIESVLPAARAQDLQRELAELTAGEGVLESSFAGYQPVNGDQPVRQRS
jgi:ribosomal protection tetracycline resistance protein